MYLDVNESDTEPIKKITILKKSPRGKTNLETENLLQDVPTELWVLSGTSVGNIKSAAPINNY